MTDKIIYGNTILKGINKAGTLKPDAKGYYTVVLGALGITNHGGERYTLTQTSRGVFDDNSVLQRRISQGLLRAEWGHPDPADYPNLMAFERRVRLIKEDRICCHIAEVWLEEIDYLGQKVMGILGRIKPSGPYGPILQKMLDNPEENVTFSGRYYSNVNRAGGTVEREIHTVMTWDFVSEPGVPCAQKYLSPTLESANDTVFYPEHLKAANDLELQHQEMALSMESSGGLKASDLIRSSGIDMRSKRAATKPPASLRW